MKLFRYEAAIHYMHVTEVVNGFCPALFKSMKIPKTMYAIIPGYIIPIKSSQIFLREIKTSIQ